MFNRIRRHFSSRLINGKKMFLRLKDSITYIASIYSSRLLANIFRIVVARVLGPKDFGLWSMFSLILLYGNLLDLGLDYALVKEVAFYRGKGEFQEMIEIKNSALTWVIIISSFCGLVTLLFSALVFSKYGYHFSIILSFIALILVLQQVKNYVMCFFVAEKNFKAVSFFAISLALISGILTTMLVIRFKLVGLPIGLALGYSLTLFYIFSKYKLKFKVQFALKRLISLVKVGFPIMLILIANTLFLTVDRILIFKYLGKENLGYYGVTIFLNNALIMLPILLGVMAFPRLSERYGATENKGQLEEIIQMPTTTVAYIISLLSGLAYIFLPAAVKIIIPQYAPGISAGRMALFGIMFFSVGIFAKNFLVAINRQMYCLFLILFSLLLKIILVLVFIKSQTGIEGVVLATNIVGFIYSIFLILSFCFYCKKRISETARYILKIYFPFFYLALILLVLNYLKSMLRLDFESELRYIIVNSMIWMILIGIPFGFLIKKDILSYLKLYNLNKSKVQINL